MPNHYSYRRKKTKAKTKTKTKARNRKAGFFRYLFRSCYDSNRVAPCDALATEGVHVSQEEEMRRKMYSQNLTAQQQYASSIKRNRQEIQKIIRRKGKLFARMLTDENINYGIYMGSREPNATLVDDLFEEDVETRQALEIIEYYSDLYDTIQESELIYGGSLA
jgi:hypothetical protein